MSGVSLDYVKMVMGAIDDDEIVIGGEVWKVCYGNKEQIKNLLKKTNRNEQIIKSVSWFELGFDNHGDPIIYDIVLNADGDIVLRRDRFESIEIIKFIVYVDKIIKLYYREFQSASYSESGREAFISEINF